MSEASTTPGVSAELGPSSDRLGRPLLDLRLSVTDRCDLRCVYCRPQARPPAPSLPRTDLLSFEEIERLARVFVRLGVRKIRITGGEPLLRAGLPDLVRRLSPLVPDLALTTNGTALAESAEPLARAGLRRVSVSLDALDQPTLRRVSGTSLAPSRVLEGIEAAERAGLRPLKVNVVVLRGVNEDAAVEIARRFRGTGRIVRFIERMEAASADPDASPVTGEEIRRRLQEIGPLRPLKATAEDGVAGRWAWCDGGGELGFITPVSQPFCGNCTRGRLSADGRFFTCLFAANGLDLRGPLRERATDAEIEALLRRVWGLRKDRHCEARSQGLAEPRPARMGFLGG